MQVVVELEDGLTQGRPAMEIQKELRALWLMKEYKAGNLSIGEFAEKMGMQYVAARDYLHENGIETAAMDKETRAAGRQAMRKLAQRLAL